MAILTTSLLRQALLATVCAMSAAAACAQTGALPSPPGGAASPAAESSRSASPGSSEDGKRNQKIENIHVEDGGAKVDEVRYGGQTQSITVQPKANVPAYEVLPNDGGRERQGQPETGTNGNGPRVWNVLKF
jgi:hypothetical protein